MSDRPIPPGQDIPGDRGPEQATASMIDTEDDLDSTSDPVVVSPNDWIVLTPEHFDGTASQAHDSHDLMDGGDTSTDTHVSLYSDTEAQDQYSPLPLSYSVGKETNLQSPINPMPLAQDNPPVPYATLFTNAVRPPSYPLEKLGGSSLYWYNKGLAAGILARGPQNQQGTCVSQNGFGGSPLNTPGPASALFSEQYDKNPQGTENLAIMNKEPERWSFINTGVADFEDCREYGQSSPPEITPASSTGLLSQDRAYPSMGIADISQLEGKMQQPVKSDMYGVPVTNRYQRLRIPQAPALASDTSQAQASGTQSYNEDSSRTAEFRNYGITSPLINSSLGSNVLGFEALSISSKRQPDTTNLANPPEAAAPPVFSQNQIPFQEGGGQFTALPVQPCNDWDNNQVRSDSDDYLPAFQWLKDYEEPQQLQHGLGIELGEETGISDYLERESSIQASEDGYVDMRRGAVGTEAPFREQSGPFQPSMSLDTIMENPMESEVSTSTNASVISGTGIPPFEGSWYGSKALSERARIESYRGGITGLNSRANIRCVPQALRTRLPGQMQQYGASNYLSPAGNTLQNATAIQQIQQMGVPEGQTSWRNPFQMEYDPIAIHPVFRSAIQNRNYGSYSQLSSQQSHTPAASEGLQGNRYVAERASAMPPRFNSSAVSSRQHIPAGVIKGQPKISKELPISPMQTEAPVVAQTGCGSPALGSGIAKKRKIEYRSNSPSDIPVAKRTQLTIAKSPETVISGDDTPMFSDPRHAKYSRKRKVRTFEVVERNADNSTSGNLSIDLPQGSRQSLPVRKSSGLQKTPEPNRPQIQQPNPAFLDTLLGKLSVLVTNQDNILDKFKEWEEKYGACLYGHYMGDSRSPLNSDIEIEVIPEDHAVMQTQGASLLNITQAISRTLARVIMNMTKEQREPLSKSIMYFWKSARLGEQVLAIERVANTRLMAKLILDERDKWRAPAQEESNSDVTSADATE